METTKVIIFDWMRTLYDPERQRLMSGALRLCRKLTSKQVILAIISRGEPERKRQIRESTLAKYCSTLSVEKEKSLRQFRRIVARFQPGADFFVVGDRVKEEIRMGNFLGLTTIWLRKGKFRKEVPQKLSEQPNFTIRSLGEVWPIIFP